MDTAKKIILIGDDDAFFRKLLSMKLTAAGYTVYTAVNGEEVLENIESKKPDLLLLDLIMPVRDGFYVLKELQKSQTLPKMKTIVISSLGQQEDKDLVSKLGAVACLSKIDINGLVTQVGKYC